jgi:DNA-binding transcriptional LysR family regulator
MRPASLVILEFADQMEASSNRLETRVFGRDQCVRGLPRVTLAPTLATYLLMPDFANFARLHPEVEMEILSSNEPVTLTNREADVAIRVVYDRNSLPLNLHGLCRGANRRGTAGARDDDVALVYSRCRLAAGEGAGH